VVVLNYLRHDLNLIQHCQESFTAVFHVTADRASTFCLQPVAVCAAQIIQMHIS